MARSESCFTRPRSCETNSTVILRSRSSSNLRTQRLAKTASPTARASSTIRISGSTWIAVAKASRTYMPLEYSLTGRAINSPISAKASMEGMARSISARLSPMISPFRKTFSRPLNSGLKPAPNSSRAAMRPRVTTRPLVGCRMPATICSSVLLPEPFGPYQRQRLAFFDLEADIAQRPKIGMELALVERQRLAQAVGGTAVELVELGDVLDQYHKVLL